MQTLRKFTFALAVLLGLPALLHAQPQQKLWQKLAAFPHRVLTVHFLEFGGPPRIGFVGCENAIYRTTDGGETWRESTYIRALSDDPFLAADFTFKDSLHGWCSNWSDNATYAYYSTTDGGQTWVGSGSAPLIYTSSVHYHASNGVLLLSGWTNSQFGTRSCLSTDDGSTWQIFMRGTQLNGYAFLDKNFGVATNIGGGHYQQTTDGGLTWQECNTGANESWQPAADTTNRTVWAAGEIVSTLDVSTDNGQNFTDIFSSGFHSTGTLRVGPCGMLYAQRATTPAKDFDDSIQGIVYSSDNGRTWQSLTDKNGAVGPFGYADTRFYVKGSYIYALSTANEVWRYIGDSTKYDGGASQKPQALAKELRIFSSDCSPATKPLYIEFLNDCASAQLVEAHIEPPDRFKLTPVSLPQNLSGDVPLFVEHDPLFRTADTARLELTYNSRGHISYDTILLTSAISGDRYMPRVEPSVNGELAPIVKSGDTITVAFTLLDTIPASLGLDSIGINTIFDSTVLERVGGPLLSSPFSLLREEYTQGTETLVLRIASSDLPKNATLAKLQYKTYLTPERSAMYSVRDVRFNDSVFNGCIASARIDPLVLPIIVLGCGDATARAFLRGEPIVQILGISPDGVTVRSTQAAQSTLMICNALGECVAQQPLGLSVGTSNIQLPALHSGMYVCVLRANGAIATKSFVVVH